MMTTEAHGITKMIHDLMKSQRVTQVMLAERLGRTQGAVSRALRSLDLKTLAPIMTALGYFMEIKFRPLPEQRQDARRLALTVQCPKCGAGPGSTCFPWHKHPDWRRKLLERFPNRRAPPHRERIDVARGLLLKARLTP